MSKVVQQWEQAYVFTEDELGFLAESQKALSQPLQLRSEEAPADHSPTSWIAREIHSAVAALTATPPVETPASELLAELEDRVAIAHRLATRLEDLQRRIAELQGSHEAVKSKSLVMQSLWDGLVSKQMEYSAIIGKIKDELEPYLQYEAIYKTLIESKDILASSALQALAQASRHHLHLQQRAKGHLDAPLYSQRYHGLLSHGIKALQSAVIAELDSVTKLSSARFRDPTLPVLADVNAEFLLTAAKLATPLDTLNACSEPHQEFGEVMVTVVSRYLACRSSLLHFFFSNYHAPAETDAMEQLIALVHHAMGEERIIAERLLVSTFRSFSIQYKKMIDGVMVPVLRRIRTLYDDTPVEKQSVLRAKMVQDIARLRPANDEQRRILQVLGDFFSHSPPL